MGPTHTYDLNPGFTCIAYAWYSQCLWYYSSSLQSIQESQKLHLESEMDIADHRPLYAMDTGPKVRGM